MNFMKVIDQTVREIKREVNLKVLKVPEIEQKVLDATDNEPWGPHGSALAEIAQATKKFTDCQMIMNVLWTRLKETGSDWRYVYKALAVIEYLVAHGSERAVDDIIEHSFQISSLVAFEYVEPNQKDVGINVRKKSETIVSLINDKDKVQEVRNKAAANRDKYFGLSSTGITHKSTSVSFGSDKLHNDQFGSLGNSKEADDCSDRGKVDGIVIRKSNSSSGNENEVKSIKKFTHSESKSGSLFTTSAKPPSKSSYSTEHDVPSSKYNDDFDDFDPRGTHHIESGGGSFNQVDLFGQSLVGNLMDEPLPVASGTAASDVSDTAKVDLFADAFISAPHQSNSLESPQGNSVQQRLEVDFFATQPAMSPPSAAVDLFPSQEVQIDMGAPHSETVHTNTADPFLTVPLNSFDGSDGFGEFSSHTAVDSTHGIGPADIKTSNKKDAFQIKSGIWADSLSRGLIDLNISTPKKGPPLVDVNKGAGGSSFRGSSRGPASGLHGVGFM